VRLENEILALIWLSTCGLEGGEKEKMKIQKEREESRQKDSKIFFIV
jgi:hypothetical protein